MLRQLTRFTQICLAVVLVSFASLVNAAPEVGKTYYTKHNFKFEKGRHVTTNYWRGELISLNSKAKVISMGGKKMVLEINGQNITILNVAKHSKKSLEQVADNLLSTKPVSLGKKFANDIKFGNLRLGMTKKQAIMTRGYPPAHKTPSTESNLWVYWSSKFIQLSLAFENGKISRGRGLN